MAEAARTNETLKDAILDAALIHVPFDGWSETTFRAAASDAGTTAAYARALFPAGPVDLALAFHERGDKAMIARLRSEDLSALKFRERVARAVRYRIEAIEDREAVRRGATLFSLPQNAAYGTRAVWNTADRIWDTLGDMSDDLNWYSKRTILAGVYGAAVLYWLGDDSPGHRNTWEFLDRRIEDVMRFEKVKAAVNKNPLLRPFMAGPNWLARQIRPPMKNPPADLPGVWRSQSAGQGQVQE